MKPRLIIELESTGGDPHGDMLDVTEDLSEAATNAERYLLNEHPVVRLSVNGEWYDMTAVRWRVSS